MGKEWIVVEEKNLDAAKKKACTILSVDPEKVEYEVLQTAAKGFMGIGGKMTRLKARIKDEPAEEESEEKELALAMAAIIDGKLQLQIPEGAQPPLLIPEKNVVLVVDGEEKTEPVAVGSQQQVEIRMAEHEPFSEVSIQVSDDKMTALLYINKVNGMKFRLRDIPPTARLRLSAEIVEETPAPEVSQEEVEKKIKDAGISFGIDRQAIQQSFTNGRATVIARGKEPLPGKDAYLEKCFQEEIVSGTGTKVGILNIKEVAAVAENQVLVIKHPAVPGQPGLNVLGGEIPPPESKDITLKAGSGARLSGDGMRAEAATNGRPALEGDIVVVYPYFEVKGDVGAATGHISFKGDVIIRGDVLDNMEVEAQGRVVIEGNANQCDIKAGREVIINGNAIGAKLQCGGTSLLCGRGAARTEEFAAKINQLRDAFQQLKESKALKDKISGRAAGVVFKGLLETKFAHLPSVIKTWREETASAAVVMDEKEMLELHEFFEILLGRGPLSFGSVSDIDTFFEDAEKQLEALHKKLKDFAAAKADLTVSYSQESTLAASGQVLVKGKGCYYTNIYAGGEVKINGSPGVFRGGEIRAGGNVFVRELGSTSESATDVSTGRNGCIKCEKVYPGVVLTAGVRVKHFESVAENVEFRE